jgi:hypothetical protein
MRVQNVIAGGLFDVRFSRRPVELIKKSKMGGEVASAKRMKAFCLISRVIDRTAKGKDNYERLVEVGVLDSRRPNKPLSRKRSLAKALRELGCTVEQRRVFWGAYFKKFGVEEFDSFPESVLAVMEGSMPIMAEPIAK